VIFAHDHGRITLYKRFVGEAARRAIAWKKEKRHIQLAFTALRREFSVTFA